MEARPHAMDVAFERVAADAGGVALLAADRIASRMRDAGDGCEHDGANGPACASPQTHQALAMATSEGRIEPDQAMPGPHEAIVSLGKDPVSRYVAEAGAR